jgi:hypothetical protein
MDRWSLYTGKLYRENARGRREQVVASTGGRYIQVVAKAGLTVCRQGLHQLHCASFKCLFLSVNDGSFFVTNDAKLFLLTRVEDGISFPVISLESQLQL